MWTSVPQMDAMSTRITTSEGVGSGIGTFRTSVLFGAALSFTAAFIIDVMTQVSRPRACAWARRISTLYHSIRPSEAALASLSSTLNRMEFRRAVSHEHEQVFPFVELLVQRGIARVDTEDRRHHELRGRRDHDYVLRPDSSQDCGTHLEVPPSEDETLGADWAYHELHPRVAVQEREDPLLVQILRDRLATDDRIDSEERLVDPNRGRDRVDRGTGTQEEQGVRFGLEEFREVHRELAAECLFADLVDHDFPSRDEVRFDQSLCRREQLHPPLALAVGLFIEVEDFCRTDSKLSAEVAHQEMRCRRRRDREEAGVHLDARRDPEDRDSIARRFGDVSRGSVAAAKQEELAPSVHASHNAASRVCRGRSLPLGGVDYLARVLWNSRRPERSRAHRAAARQPPDAKVLVAVR